MLLRACGKIDWNKPAPVGGLRRHPGLEQQERLPGRVRGCPGGLSHLGRDHVGTAEAAFAAKLHRGGSSDRDELVDLMARPSVPANQPRRPVAGLSEKSGQLKMRLDDSPGGSLWLLGVLETVALGVGGKLMLWTPLAAASEAFPGLRGPEYGVLEQRAL